MSNRLAYREKEFGSSKWKSEWTEQVYRYALLGATFKQMGEFFKVNENTVKYWAVNNDEFSEAYSRGKMEADARVANAWLQRALGYDYEEVKTIVNKKGEISVERVNRHVPADTTAFIKWMAIRQRETWTEISKSEHTVIHKGSIDIKYVSDMLKDKKRFSDEELHQALHVSLKQLAENAGN